MSMQSVTNVSRGFALCLVCPPTSHFMFQYFYCCAHAQMRNISYLCKSTAS